MEINRDIMIEELTKRIIELIHGKEYKKAIRCEKFVSSGPAEGLNGVLCEETTWTIFPITLSRVLQAMRNTDLVLPRCGSNVYNDFVIQAGNGTAIGTPIKWKLLTDDKQTANLSHQSEETINKLYELLK